jgi:hypothetical protein
VLETGIAKIESVLAENAVAEDEKLGSLLVHMEFVTIVTVLAGPELETTSATVFETSRVVASSAKTVPPQAISAKGLPLATSATTVHVLPSVMVRCESGQVVAVPL